MEIINLIYRVMWLTIMACRAAGDKPETSILSHGDSPVSEPNNCIAPNGRNDNPDRRSGLLYQRP